VKLKKYFVLLSFLSILSIHSTYNVSAYTLYDTHTVGYLSTKDAEISVGINGQADIEITAVYGNVSFELVDEENHALWEDGKVYETLTIDTVQVSLSENESISWRQNSMGETTVYLILHNENTILQNTYVKILQNVVVLPIFWAVLGGILACVGVQILYLKKKQNLKSVYYTRVLQTNDNYKFGRIISYLGELTIIVQGLLIYRIEKISVDFSPYTPLFAILFFLIIEGIINIYDRLDRFAFKKTKRFIIYFFLYLFASVSLHIGGGWYVGTILTCIGGLMRYLAPKKQMTSQLDKIINQIKTWSKTFKIRVWVVLLICIVIAPFIPVLSFNPNINGSSTIKSGDAPNYNNTLYITPIFEQANANPSELAVIKEMLGPSGDYCKIGYSLSCWYSLAINSTINATSGIYDFDPSMLYDKLQAAEDYNIPVLFHVNGGNWAISNTDNPMNIELYNNVSNVQWDQFNNIPSNITPPGEMPRKLFTFSQRTDITQIREIHLKQAVSIIYNWSLSHPDLFVGCSTDSEMHMVFNEREDGSVLYYDYNPLVIEEFQWWLEDKYSNINVVNEKFGLSTSAFTKIDPPRNQENSVYWDEWALFRQYLVQQAVELQCKWISECGIPREMIYSHQILCTPIDQKDSNKNYYGQGDVRETAITAYGVGGWTLYEPLSIYTVSEINKLSGNQWGLFEWNLWGEYNYEKILLQLKLMYKFGIHVLCPNGWIENYNSGIFVKYNDALIRAIKDFVAEIKDEPRGSANIGKLTITDYTFFFYQVHYEYTNDHLFVLAFPLLISLSTLFSMNFYRKKRREK
jgi:hypothetical protein